MGDRMSVERIKRTVEDLLARADVGLDGARPWDLRVHDEGFYPRVLARGSLGLGEAYVDGWWDCPRLDEFFDRVARARLQDAIKPWAAFRDLVRARLLNRQSVSRAFQIGERHYDVGNDLYRRMLGERMMYSCGYWKEAATLDEAQEAKLDLICRKLGLEAGMRVLDIGCGWGGAARFAAERYGARVVGVTVSEEQVRLAR